MDPWRHRPEWVVRACLSQQVRNHQITMHACSHHNDWVAIPLLLSCLLSHTSRSLHWAGNTVWTSCECHLQQIAQINAHEVRTSLPPTHPCTLHLNSSTCLGWPHFQSRPRWPYGSGGAVPLWLSGLGRLARLPSLEHHHGRRR